MKIDRSRFLLLAGSLAATSAAAVFSTTACNTKSSDADAGADAGTTQVGSDSGGGSNDSGATSDGGSDAGSDAGACLGNAPDAGPNCVFGGLDGGANCSGVLCEAWSPRFKTQVASAIYDCLQIAPTCEDTSCVEKKLAQACPDPTSEAFCTPLVTQCAANDAGAVFSQAVCVKLANGLTTNGRTALSSCIIEGIGDCEICLESAKTPL